MGNSFGKLFKLTSFGESHGKIIGGVIDGCPSNIEIDLDYIQNKLDKRKPGQSDITTDRKEDDKLEILSGVFENKTLGTPLAFIVKNNSFDSSSYIKIKDFYFSLDENAIYDGQSLKNIYMTSFLQLIIEKLTPIKAIIVHGGWIEIDTINDLERLSK